MTKAVFACPNMGWQHGFFMNFTYGVRIQLVTF